MGFIFTLIFVFTSYLSPETVFGSLAAYHIEVPIALAAFIFSLAASEGSDILRLPQTYAIVGLSVAIAFSLIFSGWIGGAPIALMDFLPKSLVFIFIVTNFKKKGQLQILVALLFFVALFIIVHGSLALRAGDSLSPWLYSQHVGETTVYIFRIRGLSFLSDPNDLAQFMVGLTPLLFLFWVRGKFVRNLFVVLLPVAVLVYGMFLTHSRGGMLALMVASVVAGRRKIGTVRAIVGGAVLFVCLSAVGWTGGRDVSSGADRMDAWSEGLVLLRTHPIFGVGYRRFTDHYPITAHNSVVVCAAELGLVGLLSWLLLIVPTIRDASVGGVQDEKKSEEELPVGWPSYRSPKPLETPEPAPKLAYASAGLSPVAGEKALLNRVGSPDSDRLEMAPATQPARAAAVVVPARFIDPMADQNTLSEAEVRRMSGLALVSMAGFLTAGWFLSRSYTMPLFVNAGIAAAIYRISRDHGIAPPPLELSQALKMAGITAVGLIIFVYIFLRISGILGMA